jgi:ATPase subunit of ABC transporter with duplicated ATPase domains
LAFHHPPPTTFTMENFKGIVLISSHDHTFLQTVANRIIELTPKGVVNKLMTFDEFLENKKAGKLQLA